MQVPNFPMAAGSVVTLACVLSGLPGGDAASFEAPVKLTSGEARLGASVRYPSPRLVDFDGDGTREMVVGDLAGLVRVATSVGGVGGLSWGELAPLATDGRQLKFNNW